MWPEFVYLEMLLQKRVRKLRVLKYKLVLTVL